MSDEHRLFNNMGDNHNSRTAFDLNGPSINFGWRFVQGSANGPGVTGTQFYTEYVGLGNEYPATGAGSYGMQIAYPRNVTEPYITIRYNEANTFASWQKVSAGNSDKLGGQAGSYYGIASDVTAAFLRANNSLLSSSYTAADVLAKLITVDGAGTTLDADLLDGQQGSYYGIATDVTAANRVANASFLHANAGYAFANSIAITANLAFAHANLAFANGNTVIQTAQSAFNQANLSYLHANAAFASANAGQATANVALGRSNVLFISANSAWDKANVANITADRAWNHANAAFALANNALLASSYTAADVLAKLITVDGAGTNLDADLLDGQQGSYYLANVSGTSFAGNLTVSGLYATTNVGIGTLIPNTFVRLHSTGAIMANGSLTPSAFASWANGCIVIDYVPSGVTTGARVIAHSSNTAVRSPLLFYVSTGEGAGAGAVLGMAIDPAGNVFVGSTSAGSRIYVDNISGNTGFGRTDPRSRVDVVGTVNASAYLVNGAPLSSGGGASNGKSIIISMIFGR
jgi:hypothetical protein